MGSIIKVNEYKDFNNNAIMTSDGAGNVTPNASGIKNTPSFGVYLNANQSISNNTLTKITFNAEYYDTDSAFDSNKFTVPSGKAGKYFFNSSFRYDNGSAYDVSNIIYKNGVAFIKVRFKQNTAVDTIQVTGVLDLSAGDYVEIYGLQNQGGSVDINGDASGTDATTARFFGYKLIG